MLENDLSCEWYITTDFTNPARIQYVEFVNEEIELLNELLRGMERRSEQPEYTEAIVVLKRIIEKIK
jgi:hypothetical protein